jgi:putative N6-adenine-specific DNA methylase
MPSLVATCARGAERAVKHELKALGVEKSRSGKGAVLFDGPLSVLADLNVFSRCASKGLWVLAEFKADREKRLIAQLAEIPFEDHLDRRTTFAIEAHLREAPWTHTRFAAQRVKDVVVDRMREAKRFRPDVDPRTPMVRYVLHWEGDAVTFSIDTTGMPLHRRGYRTEGGEAPLKENLAATLLALGHADVNRPFLDPCAGSGTLAIEQALRALKRAPGAGRRFAIDRWRKAPDELKSALEDARARAADEATDEAPAPIVARDIDADAVERTKANAARAGVQDFVEVSRADARETSIADDSVVVSNLPYGERLSKGDERALRELYGGLGEQLKKATGVRALLLTAREDAEELVDIGRSTRRWSLYNGPLRTMLRRWDL